MTITEIRCPRSAHDRRVSGTSFNIPFQLPPCLSLRRTFCLTLTMPDNEVDDYFYARRDITCLSSLLAALEHWRFTGPELDYRPRPRLMSEADQRRLFYTALADVSSTMDRFSCSHWLPRRGPEGSIGGVDLEIRYLACFYYETNVT